MYKTNGSVNPVYGAYDAHNKWNAAIDVNGKTYRYRVECLIINGDKVFVSLDKHGNLIIPGGSAEKDIDDITQVANECREEARINIKNPTYTGINRVQDYPPHISKHKSVLPFEYDGSLSKVYVAEYNSDYNGYIDEYDKDEKMIRGKFVPLKDVINRLKPEWINALNNYTNKYHNVMYNEACKDVKTARKFVSEVGKLAKKYDANYFIVTDGASGIHNNGNPAVKNARDSQVEWEKKHGFDPDEDWSKTNINESFETFLTTNPFENTMHLYHASHNQEKLKTINPLSKNFGSRISSMRLSSFWAVDKNVAIIMAIVKLIGMCGYKAQCISGSRFAILNHSESEYDDIMDSLKDKVIWLYEKTMPKKYVKIGHDNVMEEYSIDIPVSPDKSILYTFNDYKKFVTKDKIVFLTEDFLQSKGKIWYNKFINNEMKIIKKANGRFLGNILFKNYGTKGMMNKDFKSLNSNVNESVKRSELPDDVFGIPQERKYPMQDKQHVKAAIKFFNYVEPKYEEQLANRIIENMERYNIDTSSIGDKNRLKKYIKESTMEGSYSNMRESLADDLAFMYFESENDSSIPDLIEPIIKQLESKGYQVKYASPGHINTRFGNDKNKDGVINAKMTSTARIIFSRDYHFNTTPQGWEWKVLHNDAKALYVKPYTYNEKMGSKEDAFKKWQTFYISNIKTWAAELPKVGSDKKTAPDTNF